MRDYFRGLSEAIGRGWSEYWFQPSDPASLGLLRALVGLVAIYFVASYSPDLERLFGPDGLLPKESVEKFLQSPEEEEGRLDARISYLRDIQSPAALWVAHALGLIVLSLYTAGIFCRYTSVLSLLVVLAYIHRAPMLTGPLEPVLAFAMFYLCLGPSGAWFSVDAMLRARGQSGLSARDVSSVPTTIATRLLQLHSSLVYAMMGITMLSAPSHAWWDGEAVWYILARPDSRLVDLSFLHDHPYMINAWSHWIVFYQLAFATLIWNRWARPLLLVLGVPHWLLLALITGLAPFCVLMLMLQIAFIPGHAVRTLINSRRKHSREAATDLPLEPVS